jgi:23S rRNA (uracil1939-C5)-methyltransferase
MRAELDITELSPGGEGVGHLEMKGERRAVFVPGVIAGERVDVDIDPKPRPARGTLLRVLSPSPDRATPPCAHVERCGGCDWMHLTPSAQATAHASIVSRLLGVDVVAHAAPKSLGYRTRARVHVEAKAKAKNAVIAGMFARKSREPAAVSECVVLDPTIDRARLALEAYLGGARGRGDAQIALGHDRKPVIELKWHGELPADVFRRCETAVKDGQLGGARIFAGDVSVPATIGDPTPVVRGADGAALKLAPGGFSQATEEGNTLLAQRVATLASGTDAAVELYAGAGNLTVLLAKGRELVAVESSKEACVAARANLAARGLDAKVVEADAATFAIPKATRLLVLDPPREGARAVCAAIAGAKTKLARIVYVSCDPPTLARDVKLLAEAGWKIATAETFEMFPHTSHVETVVSLVKE